MKVEYISFQNRVARAEFVASKFRHLLGGKILDLGCDEANLRKLLSASNYTGIDIGGQPDLTLDLESIEQLPFTDSIFDVVVCIDVLEHLDNLHQIFAELVRVTGKYIILSLPNGWANARKPIAKGQGTFAWYGLPANKPKDRHKWFFNISEAHDFLDTQTKCYPISISDIFAAEKPRSLLRRMLLRLFHPSQEQYLNRYARALWVVLEKQ